MSRRVAVIGASGQLGSELMRAFGDERPLALDHADFAIEDAAALDRLFSSDPPEIVINTAAFHNVVQCEREPERAFAVNALAVDALAARCAQAGSVLVTLSTDYVFDGESTEPYRESDAPRPLNVYGVSKYVGERLADRHGERLFVIRTAGLYGHRTSTAKGYTFIDRILNQAANGEAIRVVDDVIFSPSYAVDVADAIRRIVDRGRFGIYHVTNAGACSWYEFATTGLQFAGLDVPVARTSHREFEQNVRRPSYTALAHDAIAAAGIADLSDWRDGLRTYIERRVARALA